MEEKQRSQVGGHGLFCPTGDHVRQFRANALHVSRTSICSITLKSDNGHARIIAKFVAYKHLDTIHCTIKD